MKTVTRVLPGESIVCVSYMVYKRAKEEGDIQTGRKRDRNKLCVD